MKNFEIILNALGDTIIEKNEEIDQLKEKIEWKDLVLKSLETKETN